MFHFQSPRVWIPHSHAIGVENYAIPAVLSAGYFSSQRFGFTIQITDEINNGPRTFRDNSGGDIMQVHGAEPKIQPQRPIAC